MEFIIHKPAPATNPRQAAIYCVAVACTGQMSSLLQRIIDNQIGQLNAKMELLRIFAFVIAIGTDQYCKLIYWALMRF